MAAVYYQYSSGTDIFNSGVTMGSSPVSSSILDSLISSSSLAILTDVSVQTQENIQFFASFDDVIKAFHFGKALGNLTISGMGFVGCSGELDGLDKFFDAVSNNRGVNVVCSIGKYSFTGLIVSSQAAIQDSMETGTIVNFAFNIAVTESTLQQITAVQSSC